ncbi:serine hydrolase-domain-containing protein [Daldinia caldariorum]|uniref:serine hydrolase-domain-containing protein n=1 Tax=Daldinia caldariorum TaxID=326644 RepID=UPI002008E902|nr:serine hydrolase-domain-containing protein [Daldinia caldariorum]KAI1465982.1 serine hydrolase-domain-containing protein [Daldinia caldariorum]
MRFLCLPGAYGSAKNFGVQLGPFAKHMEDRGLATFVFTQGANEVEPPLGWENYFGSRPLYRFVETSGGTGDAFEILRRVHHIPRGLSPEATLRLFKPPRPVEFDWTPFRKALDGIFETIEADPEIDGLIGYSEGAMMAACICAEETRRWEKKGIPRRIKFAIFFAGSPPLVAEGEGFTARLADEHGTSISIPTCHVFGSNDPLVYSSVALYNTCDQDSAQLYDHGLGHLVPRDADNVKQLGDVLADVISRINVDKEGEKGKEKDKGKVVIATATAAASAAGEAEPVSASDTEPPSAGEYSAMGPSSAASSDGSSSDLGSRSSHGAGSEGIAKV